MDVSLSVRSGVYTGTFLFAAATAFAESQDPQRESSKKLEITTAYVTQPHTGGARVPEVIVTSRVTSRDLDLNTREGLLTLEARVHAAAVEVCDELKARGQPSRSAERACVETVSSEALARTRKLLAQAN